MKKFKLVLAITVVMMMLLQSVAFAAMPNGTVVIGDQAFSLAFANDPANVAVIQSAIVANVSGKVFVKGFDGNWVDNATGAAITDISVIPMVTYKSASTTGTVHYSVGDVDFPIGAPVPLGSFTDYKTLKLTFNKQVAAITGTTIAVKINGVAEEAANVSALSADGKYITVTRDAGFAAGSYQVSVSGVKDMLETAIDANMPVSVVKATSHIATVTIVTTGIEKTENSTVEKRVYFTAKDQFGQVITTNADSAYTLKASATMFGGTFPLGNLTIASGYVVIPAIAALTENAIVTVTIGYITKDLAGVDLPIVVLATKDIVVGAYRPTGSSIISVKLVTSDKASIAMTGTTADNNVAISAQLLDQYLSNFDSALLWTSSVKDVLDFSTSNASVASDGLYANTSSNVLLVNLKKAGTTRITAFLASNPNVQAYFDLTVLPAVLATLSAPSFGAMQYNAEYLVSTTAFAANTGATLDKNTIKFQVTAFPTGAVATDLVTSVTYGTTTPTASSLYITAGTLKPGTYKFRAYVGASYTDAAAIISPEMTITTVLNPVPRTIEVEAITGNQLSSESTISRNITFKNVHGEVIDVSADQLVISPINNLIVTKYAAKSTNGLTETVATGSMPVKYLKIYAIAEGNGYMTLSTNIITSTAVTTIYTTAVAKSVPKTIAIDASSVNTIINDTLDELTVSETDRTVKAVNGYTYKAVKFDVYDQYGNVYPFVNDAGYKIDITAAPSHAPIVEILPALTTSITSAAITANMAVPYIGIRANADTTAQTITVRLMDKSTPAVEIASRTLQVNVSSARALSSISSNRTSVSVVKGSSQAVVISGLDQYGRTFAIDKNVLKMVAAPTVTPAIAEYTSSNAIDAADSNKVDVTFSTNNDTSATSYSLVLYYDINANDIKDTGELSITLPMTVNQSGVLIDSIKIDKTVYGWWYGSNDTDVFGARFSADASVYKIYLADGTNAFNLSTKAFNTSGGEVGVLASDIIYTITSATTLAGGSNSPAGPNVTLVGSVLKVKSTSGNSVVGANVTVKATSANGKTDSIDFVFERQSAAPQSGTYYFGLTSTAVKADAKTTLTLNSTTAVARKLDLYVVAIDQFGFVIPVTAVLPISRDDTSFFTATDAAGKITITAVKAGTTNLRVVIDSDNTLVIPVTIEQSAVDQLIS